MAMTTKKSVQLNSLIHMCALLTKLGCVLREREHASCSHNTHTAIVVYLCVCMSNEIELSKQQSTIKANSILLQSDGL